MVQEVRDALALDLLKQLLHLAQVLDSDQFTFGFALEQGTFFFCAGFIVEQMSYMKKGRLGVVPLTTLHSC